MLYRGNRATFSVTNNGTELRGGNRLMPRRDQTLATTSQTFAQELYTVISRRRMKNKPYWLIRMDTAARNLSCFG
jgi:hypothetical protein